MMRLWDSLLTDTARFAFLTYFCAAVVLSIRDELIASNDFAFCVKVRAAAAAAVLQYVVNRNNKRQGTSSISTWS